MSVKLSKIQDTGFTSNGTIALPCCPKFPVVPVFKLIVFVTVFVLALASTHFRFTNPSDGRFTPEAVINLQHMSMFGPFIFHSMVELFTWRGWHVPDGFGDIAAAISLSWGAFSIESEQNQAEYADLIHELPANLLYLTSCVSLVEYYTGYRSIVASLLKGYFLLCFGTWYINSNYIPYSNTYLGEVPDPEWNQTDEIIIKDIIMAVFGCHLILGQIIVGLLFSTLYYIYSRNEPILSTMEEDSEMEIILYEKCGK
ncbi:uncharacterized protein LOC117340403 [Pecten maximus]|uniref:uncharacterized protein LOC117340403 n=1 Tax=Pecten maximus TaxID=6579 RepID=UPI001458BEA3|nr:uncharacterized protein LOC117340403 [Pecten maximus]